MYTPILQKSREFRSCLTFLHNDLPTYTYNKYYILKNIKKDAGDTWNIEIEVYFNISIKNFYKRVLIFWQTITYVSGY